MRKESLPIEVRLLTSADYSAWKTAHMNQKDPVNKWDRAHRKEDLSKSAFNKLLKSQKENRLSEKNITYGIFLKKTGEFCGYVMAMDVIRGITQSAYLGYTLLNQFWGQGIAYYALQKFFVIAFKELGLHRLQAGIEPHNKRSLKLARKLNMRREGVSKSIVFLRGEWQDLVQFAITSEDVGLKWKGQAKKNY